MERLNLEKFKYEMLEKNCKLREEFCMKKNVIILIMSIVIIFCVLSSLVVFAGTKSTEEGLEEKVTQEIKYLDKYLVSLISDFESIPDEDKLKEEKSKDLQKKYDDKWSSIQKKIEELYQAWNTISIDLHSMQVDGRLILAFSDYLNSATQSMNNKDKEKSMEGLADIYHLLPEYSKSYNANNKETIILRIKNNIVTAYVAKSKEDWQEAQTQLIEASKQFTNLLNSVNQDFQNQSTVNQCYVLVNELNKAAKLKDQKIFNIEYENLINKIEII